MLHSAVKLERGLFIKMNKLQKEIAIISPVYQGGNTINELVERIENMISTLVEDYEIILVNDGSRDTSWEKIKAICLENKRIIGINLSRNFGQHYAITAGLANANSKWVVVMDCDLQDLPEEIPQLYNKAKEGYDLVFAQRAKRQDGFVKKTMSRLFYRIFGYLTETEQDASIANFGIYNHKVVMAILSMRDYIRYFPAMAQWVGFRKTTIPVKHASRSDGASNYSFRKLRRLALDNMISFSDKPLRLTVKFGFFMSLASSIIAIFYVFKYLKGEIEVLGFSSLILSIWFLSGIIIFILGIVGVYIGKTFEKVKGRPLFIVDEMLNYE